MDSKTIEILNGELTAHFKPGPGRTKYRYVKGEDVIARLNQAFAHEWSSRVENIYEKGNQIIVLVSVEANGTVHQGFGGAEVAVYKDGPRKGQPVDMSNTYKSAFTNALKKAAEQFGVGLQSEDSFDVEEAPVNNSFTPHRAPPAPAAIPSGPVSGSASFSVKNDATKAPTSMEELLRNPEISKLLSNLDVKAISAQLNGAAPVAQPVNTQAARASKGYDPNASRVPEVSSPFPSPGNGEEKINDIQLNALGGLAKMKKVTPDQAIKMALPNSTKSSYAELTRNEAKDVIKALNRLDG